jgi:hypothetical protein
MESFGNQFQKEQVNFVVAPRETNRLTRIMSSQVETRLSQSSIQRGSVNGKGWKKPANAIDCTYLKKMENLVKGMIDLDLESGNSKNNIDENIECIHNQIRESIKMTKAQENVHKMIL